MDTLICDNHFAILRMNDLVFTAVLTSDAENVEFMYDWDDVTVFNKVC